MGDLGCCDHQPFCISASVTFWNATSTNMTITEGNATTIIRDSTTTIFSTGTQTHTTCQATGNSTAVTNQTSTVSSGSCTLWFSTYPSTGYYFPGGTTLHPVDVILLVQDMTTGQNTTLVNGCYVQTYVHPTQCQAGSWNLPTGHTYVVTVLVTTQDQQTLLAPERMITVVDSG